MYDVNLHRGMSHRPIIAYNFAYNYPKLVTSKYLNPREGGAQNVPHLSFMGCDKRIKDLQSSRDRGKSNIGYSTFYIN
jgi:hypothetical protein